jgi:Flp pilus assembly protein CpaB
MRADAMNPTRFLRVCCAALAFSGVLGCSAVQPPIRIPRISIPPGMRAVSLRAKVNVAVEPGTHVDVLVSGHGADAQSTILLQDIELASFEPQPGIVTLLTSPTDAKKLAIAADRGGVEVVPHH